MKMVDTIKKFFTQVLTLIPTRLPQGMSEFQEWVDSIIAIGDFPESLTRDSVEFSLATMVMHLGPTAAYKPKAYFIVAVKAAAAKQVANAAFYELKLRQRAEAAAAEEKQRAEATAKAAAPCEIL